MKKLFFDHRMLMGMACPLYGTTYPIPPGRSMERCRGRSHQCPRRLRGVLQWHILLVWRGPYEIRIERRQLLRLHRPYNWKRVGLAP